MKYIYALLRIVFGLYLFSMTAAYFGFFPKPDASMFTTSGWSFLQALEQTGYIMPTMGVVTAICGLCFLCKKWVPFAVVLLMPLTLNFALFHVFLDATPLNTAAVPAYGVFAVNLFLLWKYKERYALLFD